MPTDTRHSLVRNIQWRRLSQECLNNCNISISTASTLLDVMIQVCNEINIGSISDETQVIRYVYDLICFDNGEAIKII